MLVEVKAISVNPVDTKVRQNVAPEGGAAKVLGWDVAGVVKAVGTEVSLFKPGDKVYYAGSIARAGATASCTWSTNGLSATCPSPWVLPRRQRCR